MGDSSWTARLRRQCAGHIRWWIDLIVKHKRAGRYIGNAGHLLQRPAINDLSRKGLTQHLLDGGLPTRFNVQGRVHRPLGPQGFGFYPIIQRDPLLLIGGRLLQRHQRTHQTACLLDRGPHVILLLARLLDSGLRGLQLISQPGYFFFKCGDVPISLSDFVLQRRRTSVVNRVAQRLPLVFLLMQSLLQLGQHLLQIGNAALLNFSGLARLPGALVKLIPRLGPGLYGCLSRGEACIRFLGKCF